MTTPNKDHEFWKSPLPAVTTILKATISPEKEEALRKWKERVGEDEAERIRQAAIARGNLFHNEIEQYKKVGRCQDERILNFFEKREFNLSEYKAISDRLGYKFILDAKVTDQYGVIWTDWKTKDKPADPRFLEDEFIQLAANAWGMESLEVNPKQPERAQLVFFIPEMYGGGGVQVIERTKEELENDFKSFIRRKKEYERIKSKK